NVGLLTAAKACTDSSCSTIVSDKTFAYDSLSRPSTTTISTGGVGYTYTDTYDTYGRLATIAYPSGFTQQNTYNSLSYLCRISDNSGSPSCTSAGGANVYWTANSSDAELHLL